MNDPRDDQSRNDTAERGRRRRLFSWFGSSAPRPFDSSAPRDLGLIRRVRDEDDDDDIVQKPLEWSLIRRMFTYAAPVRRKVTALSVLTFIRAAQLPAL